MKQVLDRGGSESATVVDADDTEVAKPRTCRVCHRVNPADAAFCHYDGRPLLKDADKKAVHAGSAPFPTPFYFSDGRPCRNFNELVLAANKNWEEARAILAEGMWPMFFGAIGRFDLASVAKQAFKQPDPDRALSDFLQRLPADPDFLRPPKLELDPGRIHLKQLTPGCQRSFDLTIVNDGMLLLEGVAYTDCDWLAFSSAQTHGSAGVRMQTQKVFQTRSSCTLKVQVLGHKLRAGRIPARGKIIVESNGGTRTFEVFADIPVRPFPKGGRNNVLAGAMSPRDIALKAKESPNEAAELFEQGAVQKWYADNGWSYPVSHPCGQGKGAIQQFFEALGLTQPPMLKIRPKYLGFRGIVGERCLFILKLFTKENKPVYARATTNVDWLQPGIPEYLGNKVHIPFELTIPDFPKQTVTARIMVEGNGKQQFVVPISVTVLPRSLLSKLLGRWTQRSDGPRLV
ncbi:MAG: hypothetical protein KatS3mg105_3369 [Gemmatales bacterium]|nr:MAG: hypothetical protein KatS3mg105_3369 [Gemmatales bacterium]